MIAVGVSLAALAGRAPRGHAGPAAVDTGLVEVLHAVAVGRGQAQIRIANITGKSIAIVVGHTTLSNFASRRSGTIQHSGTTAVDVGFITVLDVVVVGCGNARAVSAMLARAIG
ncbi:MAG: hypothetical protein FWD69_02930 [Polyangiaceae bacterium]|nr:hypothetical protein [Polyangiaceae bacterium]